MAKEPTSTEDPKGPGTAVAEAEEEFLEIPILDKEDEALLTRAAEKEDKPETAEEAEAAEEAKAAPVKVEAKPKAAAKPEPKLEAKPKAEPEAKVEAEEKPPARPMTPIERAEREKRKEYARKWQSALEEQERLQARIQQLQREVKVTGEVKVPQERIAAVKGRLKAALKDASDLDVVAERAVEESLGEAAYLIGERDKHWQQEIERLQFVNRVSLSILGARVSHRDFDEVLRRSGLAAEIGERTDGSYANPYLAKRVYLATDPGEEAYQLALGRLEAEGKNGQPEDADAEKAAPRAKADTAEPAKAVPKAAVKTEADAEKDEADAERRGARKVIEQVETIASKPKGIAGLKSAAGPKTRWSKGELDALMRANPGRYQELVGKYPELERFHLS